MFWLGFISGVAASCAIVAVALHLFKANPPNFLPW